MNPPVVRDPDTQRVQIEKLAYSLWQNAGEPVGTAERDWLLAEHVVETGAVDPSVSPEQDEVSRCLTRNLL